MLRAALFACLVAGGGGIPRVHFLWICFGVGLVATVESCFRQEKTSAHRHQAVMGGS